VSSKEYQFRGEIPVAIRDKLEQLVLDGYWIHKEWSNGIELRKGKGFRGWLLFLQVLCPVMLFPGFMRSVVNNFFGYRYRLFVTIDVGELKIIMV
jgi:hypothetical protein